MIEVEIKIKTVVVTKIIMVFSSCWRRLSSFYGFFCSFIMFLRVCNSLDHMVWCFFTNLLWLLDEISNFFNFHQCKIDSLFCFDIFAVVKRVFLYVPRSLLACILSYLDLLLLVKLGYLVYIGLGLSFCLIRSSRVCPSPFWSNDTKEPLK